MSVKINANPPTKILSMNQNRIASSNPNTITTRPKGYVNRLSEFFAPHVAKSTKASGFYVGCMI